jgi:hypothetical protein
MPPLAIDIYVQADQPWQASGVASTGRFEIVCEYVDGSWTHDPATGTHDWRGAADRPAPATYALPGAPEGCLLYRFGARGPALRWPHASVVVPKHEEEVFFAVNDDLGKGLRGNQGALHMRFSVQNRRA